MTSSSSSTRLLGVEPIRWAEGRLLLLDQSRLPAQEVWLEDVAEVAAAIREMRVRGAPAIGVAAAFGVALAARASTARDMAAFRADLERAIALLRATRPTAVNLFWALERMRATAAA
ncbi:MAG: S-methyl-5-thioribose-1-phosphate isomerase, partial [Chloroflexota bacterium]